MIYQKALNSMVYKFFDKKASGSGIRNVNISNKESAKELHKSIIRNLQKRKIPLPSIDNIQGIITRKKSNRNLSAQNEGKSVFPEIYIRNLKNKIYRYTTSLSKNVYTDK